MRNPRFILVDEPDKRPALLSKVSFNLRFALAGGMQKPEFWYAPQAQKEPDMVVDLREAIRKYNEKGGPLQEAPCQQPEYKPNQKP